jgi:hypothetical protein
MLMRLVLTLLLVMPMTLHGQGSDSIVSHALTWIDYPKDSWWNDVTAAGGTRGEVQGIAVITPRTQSGSLVVYGRAVVSKVTDYVTGWTHSTGSRIQLYLMPTRYHDILSVEDDDGLRVFGARVGPLPPGRYDLQVIWAGETGNRTLIEAEVAVKPAE